MITVGLQNYVHEQSQSLGLLVIVQLLELYLARSRMPEPIETPSEAAPPQAPAAEPAEEKPKLKPCCACPETKKARDECIIEKGEAECGDLIEAHKDCMRKMGFNI